MALGEKLEFLCARFHAVARCRLRRDSPLLSPPARPTTDPTFGQYPLLAPFPSEPNGCDRAGNRGAGWHRRVTHLDLEETTVRRSPTF